MNRTISLMACATALLMSSCQLARPARPKAINSYLAEPTDLANVRRIMVLPFNAEAGIKTTAQYFDVSNQLNLLWRNIGQSCHTWRVF